MNGLLSDRKNKAMTKPLDYGQVQKLIRNMVEPFHGVLLTQEQYNMIMDESGAWLKAKVRLPRERRRWQLYYTTWSHRWAVVDRQTSGPPNMPVYFKQWWQAAQYLMIQTGV